MELFCTIVYLQIKLSKNAWQINLRRLSKYTKLHLIEIKITTLTTADFEALAVYSHKVHIQYQVCQCWA